MLDQDPSWPTALLDFPAPSSATDQPLSNQRRRLHFREPTQWLVAHDAAQVPSLLQEAHRLSKAGHWCLGWVSYEAAPGFSPHLPVKATAPGAVYALWAVFKHAHEGWPTLKAPDDWQLGPWHTDLPESQLASAIGRIHDLIRAGEVYQINLTSQRESQLADASHHHTSPPDTGTLHHLFHALHRSQPNGYAMLLDARTATRSPGAVLSVSPELFFEWDGQHIITRPMKGTAPRHPEAAADQAAAAHLQHSTKEKAENLMIVDLLRNDLSRVAQVGSVHVDSLFDVQALPTVWQMTSTVSARTRPEVTLADVFTALFPCGSVTGAPKQRAMHHIAKMEHQPRGVYCGAMGVLMPGGHATFNVPIRTVCIDTPAPAAPWRATCGIGSGITLDASIAGEQQEWQHKAIFLNRASQPFDLLESMRLENGVVQRLHLHLARLARSAQHFGFTDSAGWPAWEKTITTSLAHLAAQHPSGLYKVRLLLSPRGQIKANAQTITGPIGLAWQQRPTARQWAHLPLSSPMATVTLAASAMPPPDDFIWHKTTRRHAYQAFQAPPASLDTLLFNSSDEITEFTIGNVAVCLHGQWVTPPVSCGLLPGVMRAALLEAKLLKECRISRAELAQATGLALINSVRGWLPVHLTSPTNQPHFFVTTPDKNHHS